MTEYFMHAVLRFFTERNLLSEQIVRNMLSWRHSGFSPDAWPSSEQSERPGIDNGVQILDESSRESIAQYIALPPVSLKKIHYEAFKGRVLFHTHYNEYFKENVHMPDACPGKNRRLRPGFNTCDFLAELTQHIPPKGVHLIRRYGLYSSRTKGAWQSMSHVAERAPTGWKSRHEKQTGDPEPGDFGPKEDADFILLSHFQAVAKLRPFHSPFTLLYA